MVRWKGTNPPLWDVFLSSEHRKSEESWILIQAPQQDEMDCDSSRAGPLSWHFHGFILNPARWLKPEDKGRNIPQPHEAGQLSQRNTKQIKSNQCYSWCANRQGSIQGRARAQNPSKAKVQGLFFMTGDFPLEESFMNKVKAANHSLKIQKQ